ncbi:hypothetical protein FXO38_20700 [Capsicum annuum]|nr:hypothetical protein FXO38_20700 [Capsicum annuum]
MESGELSCDQSDVVISFLMNGRGEIYPTFIRNDRHVKLYMFSVDSNNFRSILRVKVIGRSREEASTSAPPPPQPPAEDDTSTEYYCMDGDEWDNSEDYEEEECGEGEDEQFEPQGNHSFSDDTNLFVGQTFKNKHVYVILSKK